MNTANNNYERKLPYVLANSWQSASSYLCRVITGRLKPDPFSIHLLYFIALSSAGFAILTATTTRTQPKPPYIDLFFTSVSATTVSSMSTLEMEVFSNPQLILITILMFAGGEVFTSMVGLHIKVRSRWNDDGDEKYSDDHVVTVPQSGNDHVVQFESNEVDNESSVLLEKNSIKFLAYLVLAYLLVVQILGVAAVMLYVSFLSASARNVLRSKGIKSFTFAVFLVVSTFANCGFVPTNENMIVFGKNSGLLLILILQILLGNTLFPPSLRFLIWVSGKRVKRAAEAEFLLEKPARAGYLHLLSRRHSLFLLATVAGFISIGFALFSAMEWNSGGLNGLNRVERVVGGVFQIANARHAGETIVDLSTVCPAVLVFFIFMMYLPPYTLFLPSTGINSEGTILTSKMKGKKRGALQNFIFSQLSYIVIFVIIICITERKSMADDPINFSVLNITLEVVSAYGNVGFTTGYSCTRQMKPDPGCVSKWYGFSGAWSDEGKIILILVMFFGRLKQFNASGGRAWKIL